ncbi:MAG: hypothetical protein WCR72_17115, partial [Bacteroidota bacterium]
MRKKIDHFIFSELDVTSQTTPIKAATQIVVPCSSADVSCTGNAITYNSTANTLTTSYIAPPPVLGYPNYGCLGAQPCPAFFYMQVAQNGDINIHIKQTSQGDPPIGLDVDFICWGPFNSLTEGCENGMTAAKKVACSFSGNFEEDCYIPNAQIGEIYILLITNYAGLVSGSPPKAGTPGVITFSQTFGSGVTNCNIVTYCGIVAVTTNATSCSAATNTYDLSGNIEFTNPPSNGTLTVTDLTAIPNVSQIINVTAGFTSPQPYSLIGIHCDGSVHTIKAAFSAIADCSLTDTYSAPVSNCPIATISGGGAICNDGISTVPVHVNISGNPPFNFTYTDGVTPTTVNSYSGPFPYIINANIATTYSLTSVSNFACVGPGNISGSALVQLNPLPVPVLTGPSPVCFNSAENVYSTTAGMSNYVWTIAGGTITSGGIATSNTAHVTWDGAGPHSISVSYTDINGCSAAVATSLPVVVNVLPIPTIAGDSPVCFNSSGNIYTTESGMSNYTWSISGGTIYSGGTAVNNTSTVKWDGTGPYSISVNYNNTDGCLAAVATDYPVIVNPLPEPAITGPAVVCASSTGNIYSTETGMNTYTWDIPAGGTITAGGGTSTVTVSWDTPGPQTISVNYTNLNTCTAAAASIYNVLVNPLPVPVITGKTSPCLNTTYTYTTDALMTGYTWVVSAGGSPQGGGTSVDNSITVRWDAVGAQTVSVVYTDAKGCTAAVPTVYTITVNPLPVPVIAGPQSVCLNTSGSTYTTQAGMSGYSWLVSAGGFITAGGGTGEDFITIKWIGVGPQTVSVNHTDLKECTAASATVYPVLVLPLPIPIITGPASPCVTS